VNPIETQSVQQRAVAEEAPRENGSALAAGGLIVNADDWGRSEEITNKQFDCLRCGAVSSVSAMVFMPDSERAAAMAREHGVDAGLHLNFTSAFLAANCPPRLLEQQRAVAHFLAGSPFARGLYNPFLARAFEYVVKAQIEEYARLYGRAPERLDGHHHMHLAANVLLGGLLPKGKIVRRHFSHEPREKALRHHVFRAATDALLKRRYRVIDYFFPLIPVDIPARMERIFALAGSSTVEIETHPVNPEEYKFLAGGEIFRWAGKTPVARSYDLNAATANKSSIQ
jgi:chitin disaccharide deacetylase